MNCSRPLSEDSKTELTGCYRVTSGFPGSTDGKESTCIGGDLGSIPGLGRSPGKGNGNALQYSCLENAMDRGAWWATVHGTAKHMTEQLSTHPFTLYHLFSIKKKKCPFNFSIWEVLIDISSFPLDSSLDNLLMSPSNTFFISIFFNYSISMSL